MILNRVSGFPYESSFRNPSPSPFDSVVTFRTFLLFIVVYIIVTAPFPKGIFPYELSKSEILPPPPIYVLSPVPH